MTASTIYADAQPYNRLEKHSLKIHNSERNYNYMKISSLRKGKANCLPRRKHRASFDQVSEFDQGRIVVYSDWALSFREMDERVGQNQRTVMRICHRWMQEETID
ncbi:hypothetical protein TNCV_1991141 [Trichonephila clavipes]|nr:hypothetical protein TNCV_1991141 [Trichonephila clavipes]